MGCESGRAYHPHCEALPVRGGVTERYALGLDQRDVFLSYMWLEFGYFVICGGKIVFWGYHFLLDFVIFLILDWVSQG